MVLKKRSKWAILPVYLLLFVLSLTGCSNGTKPGIAASDYAKAENWLHVPKQVQFEADIFYLYPTAYTPQSDADPDICTIDNQAMRDSAEQVYAQQATAFETCGNIFAPFYRQASPARMPDTSPEGTYSFLSQEPRTDVFAALDYYFEQYNDGRPYILAGHSQGSNMISIVLSEYMKEHPDYYSRMVAAYQIGYSVTKEYLNDNPHVAFAQKADDTGVVISWNTEGPKNINEYNFVVLENAVSINPLNWKRDETPATAAENKGSLIPDGNGGNMVGAGIADATLNLDRGSVICTCVDAAQYAAPMTELFGPESYHGWDYQFYYINIRENAALRIQAFLNQR